MTILPLDKAAELECDNCGAKFPPEDVMRGAVRELLTPSSHFTGETYDTLCIRCAVPAQRLADIRSHIGQSIVRELDRVTLSVDDALFLHSRAILKERQ